MVNKRELDIKVMNEVVDLEVEGLFRYLMRKGYSPMDAHKLLKVAMSQTAVKFQYEPRMVESTDVDTQVIDRESLQRAMREHGTDEQPVVTAIPFGE
jgi:hypothetical protein